PDTLLWLASTIALGSLAYYAPKTFLAASIGIFAYQVYGFNQLVQTADHTKHQRIHAWAINACLVMTSIGSVFMLKSLPYVWSALKDVAHFHILRSVGHIAKAVILVGIGAYLDKFHASAKDLGRRCRWVEMEDFVEHYPPEVKQNILSSYWEQFRFYISAMIPQTLPAGLFARTSFVFSQFEPENIKFSILQNYFGRTDMRDWPLAIHQFQQLPVQNQIILGPQLNFLSQGISEAERDAFPDAVKAILLNEQLKRFQQIHTWDQDTTGSWKKAMIQFDELDPDLQEILRDECLRLLQPVLSQACLNICLNFKLTALKAHLLQMARYLSTPEFEVKMTQANLIFDSLNAQQRTNLGAFLKKSIENGMLSENSLPSQIKAVIPK
ncbi:MAG TPA: hypothetical protein VIJ14_01960, partial [Rhabdochlamydiaceae bacterium]